MDRYYELRQALKDIPVDILDIDVDAELQSLDALESLHGDLSRAHDALVMSGEQDEALALYLNTKHAQTMGLESLSAIPSDNQLIAIEGILSTITKAIKEKLAKLWSFVRSLWAKNDDLLNDAERKMNEQARRAKTKDFRDEINKKTKDFATANQRRRWTLLTAKTVNIVGKRLSELSRRIQIQLTLHSNRIATLELKLKDTTNPAEITSIKAAIAKHKSIIDSYLSRKTHLEKMHKALEINTKSGAEYTLFYRKRVSQMVKEILREIKEIGAKAPKKGGVEQFNNAHDLELEIGIAKTMGGIVPAVLKLAA